MRSVGCWCSGCCAGADRRDGHWQVTPSIRTLGELVTEENILDWLAQQIAQNHRDSTRGATTISTQQNLPIHC